MFAVGPCEFPFVWHTSSKARRHLADFLSYQANTPIVDDEWTRGIIEWIRGGRPGRIVEAATRRATDSTIAGQLSEAYEYADWVQRSLT